MYHVKVINRAARVTDWQKSFRYLFTLPGKPGKEQEDSSTCCFRVRFPDASFTRPHEAAQKPYKHDKVQGD